LAPKIAAFWDYESEPTSNHVAKFHGDWPTELRDLTLRKERKKERKKNQQ